MKSIEDKMDKTIIEKYYTTFVEASKKRNELGDENDYTSMMKEIEGGKELERLLEKFNKNKKKQLNKTVFLFMKALKTYAGDFTKGHGVHELSNAMGIRALEKRKDIHKTVIDRCASDENAKKIMDWWLDCANTLYHLSVMMKSQEKLEDADIEKLKHLIADYVHTWVPQLESYGENNPIFCKNAKLLDLRK